MSTKKYGAETIIENDFRDFDEVILFNLADLHVGAQFCEYKLIHETVAFIKEVPNVFAVLGGDLIDNITKNSVGDIFEQSMSPKEQVDYVIELLFPLKDKILGSVSGNHEIRRDASNANIDWSEFIADKLDVPYNPNVIINYISVGKDERKKGRSFNYTIATTHGSGGGSTLTSATNVATKLSKSLSGCDVYFNGHTHSPLVIKLHDRMFYPQSKAVRELDSYCITTGAFLSYGGYSANKNLKSKSLGSMGVLLSGKGMRGITPMDFESASNYFTK